MPSLKSMLLKATLKTVSPLIVNADIEIRREQQDFLSRLKKTPPKVNLKPAELGSLKAEWFDYDGGPDSPVVLYFHGGAYVTGSLLSSRVLAGELAHASGLKVFSFEYRLAPEHPYPAALEDALYAYHYLLQSGFKPSEIIFAGESAGGGLLLAAALALKDNGDALPAALVCLSPWTDLTCRGQTHRKNAAKDPLLSTDSLKVSALLYAAGESLLKPYISPVYGAFEGFPPTLIQAGRDEVLYEDSAMLHESMRGVGVETSLSVWPGMWHVWHIFEIKEAHEALKEIAAFMRKSAGL